MNLDSINNLGYSYLIYEWNDVRFPLKAEDAKRRLHLKALFRMAPYLIKSCSFFKPMATLSLSQKWMSGNEFSFSKIERDAVSGVAWRDAQLNELALFLAILRTNGDRIQDIVKACFVEQENLCRASLRFETKASLDRNLLLDTELASWRISEGKEGFLAIARIETSINEAQIEAEAKLIGAQLKWEMDDLTISRHPYYIINWDEVLAYLTCEDGKSTFEKVYENKVIQHEAELVELMYKLYDEIKMTSLSSTSFETLFYLFGEATQAIAYDAFDLFMVSRNGEEAWRKALEKHVKTYSLSKANETQLLDKHVYPILTFV